MHFQIMIHNYPAIALSQQYSHMSSNHRGSALQKFCTFYIHREEFVGNQVVGTDPIFSSRVHCLRFPIHDPPEGKGGTVRAKTQSRNCEDKQLLSKSSPQFCPKFQLSSIKFSILPPSPRTHFQCTFLPGTI